MKKFVIWLTLVITLVFLAGILYWTNFIEGMLGLGWNSGGYFIYRLIMLATAVGMIVFFRKQKWI